MELYSKDIQRPKVQNTTSPKLDDKQETSKMITHVISKDNLKSKVGSFRNPHKSKTDPLPPLKPPKSSMDLPISRIDANSKGSGSYYITKSGRKKSIFAMDSRRKVSNNIPLTISKKHESIKPNNDRNDNENSVEHIKSSKLLNENDKFNSYNSGLKSSTISTEDIKHHYTSETGRENPRSATNKDLESSDLSDDKSASQKPVINIHNKYFSNNINERSKSPNLDKNHMPLTIKDSGVKRGLTSVRLSHHPKNDKLDTKEMNKVRLQLSENIKSEMKKRNPSVINKIKEKESYEQEIDKKRSKSENISENKVNFNEIVVKDIILFIQSREKNLPPFEPAKAVIKKYGIIEAFVANTHKGIVRNYNEDRVSILLNAQRKIMNIKGGSKSITNCSMFSVFDGHGGTACCNYLKEHLHNSLLDRLDIEGLIIPSIKAVYKQIDEVYTKIAVEKKSNFAGSCSITLLIINNSLMVINTGDSRTILSMKGGSRIIEASSDHKPDKLSEFYRIIESGGELYRMSSNIKTGQNNFYFAKTYSQLKNINELQRNSRYLVFGPWRVKPGGLSVSRSFGDIESKMLHMGPSNNIVTSEPDVTEFDVTDVEFAFLACKLIS